jgi:hypothetical protein
MLLGDVRQVRGAPVADVEQVTEHRHGVALLALAEQLGHRDAEVLAEQVEQRRLQGRDGVDRGALVEGLQPAAAAVPVGEGIRHRPQERPGPGHGLADEQLPGVGDRPPDGLPAGHLTDAGAARAVGDDRDRAGEERPVRATQVEQHAVVPRDGHDLHARDGRGCTHVRRPSAPGSPARRARRR